MTTITIKIPDTKKSALSAYVKNIGGEIVTSKKDNANVNDENDPDNQVTHEVFFGENIRRAIKAFSKSK